MPTKSLASIQCLRAIAALLVLSCHIGSIEGLYTSMRLLPEWGKYGVDLFFVISGFVMTYISHESWGNPANVKPFLLKRVFRIYPVYWEFTLVILAVMLIHPTILTTQGDTQTSIWKSLLLWPQLVDPLLGVGWSLVHEMYFYVLFCVAFLLPRKAIPFAFASWFLALLYVRVVGVNFGADTGEIWLITSPLGFEFMMGCALAWLYRKNVRLQPHLLLAASIIWCLLANTYFNAEESLSWRVIIWGIPSALLLYAAVMWETSRKPVFSAWLKDIGDASYSLYLSHALIVSALGKIWQKLAIDGLPMHLLFIAICVIVPLAVALINYRYFEQPISRWYHRKANDLSRR